MSQVPRILIDVLKNRNTLIFIGFLFLTKASCVINANMGSVYLTSELGFPKERLSFINVVLGPLEIITTLLSSYFAADRPFAVLWKMTLFQIFINSYMVLYVLQNFPKSTELQTDADVWHLAIVKMLVDLAENVHFVIMFAIVSKVVDKRITGMHITLLASLINQTTFAHKFYIYELAERFDLFVPQTYICVVSLIVAFLFKSRLVELDDASLESWQVSNEVIPTDEKE